jgi:hypothetical protein
MKILIREEEKDVILDMHSKMKKNNVVSEQIGADIESQLKSFIDDGRVVGTVVPMNSSNPQLKFAIKQESTKNPGKFRYLFIDKRIGMVENGKFTFVKDTVWTPGQPKPKVDPSVGDVSQEVSAGWTKREDLKNVSDAELADLYDQHPKYKNLYRLKTGKDKKGGFTADQQSFIDAWTGSTQEMRDKFSTDAYKFNPSAADFATGQWTRNNYFIAPGSEVYFPADEKGQKGLKIFINAAKLSKEPNRENCRAAIKTFVNMYRQSRGGLEPNAQVFAETKALVKLCKATIKFGGPFSKIDDDLNLLAGQTVDGIKGPTSLDSQNNPNPWRID